MTPDERIQQIDRDIDDQGSPSLDDSRWLLSTLRDALDLDAYTLRERGFRVLDDDQCCELGCSGGACESCPCCCAGWCVAGHSGEIPDPANDSENYAIWLEEAAEHNPVAGRLAAVEAELRDARAENEKFRERLNEHVGCEHRAAAELRELHAELAAERAKVERATDVDLIRRAIADPGQFLPRGDNYAEPIPSWSARAVVAALTRGER